MTASRCSWEDISKRRGRLGLARKHGNIERHVFPTEHTGYLEHKRKAEFSASNFVGDAAFGLVEPRTLHTGRQLTVGDAVTGKEAFNKRRASTLQSTVGDPALPSRLRFEDLSTALSFGPREAGEPNSTTCLSRWLRIQRPLALPRMFHHRPARPPAAREVNTQARLPSFN